MITEKQLLEEYGLACYAVVEVAKALESDKDYRDTWLLLISKRDTLADLLVRYYNVDKKLLQQILDKANNVNYHV